MKMRVFDTVTEQIVPVWDHREGDSGIEFLTYMAEKWQWLPADRFVPVVTEEREPHPIFIDMRR